MDVEEHNQVVKDLEELGIQIRTDPLNALGEDGKAIKEKEPAAEEEEEGIISFTNHSLTGQSKIDAFESKREILFLLKDIYLYILINFKIFPLIIQVQKRRRKMF